MPPAARFRFRLATKLFWSHLLAVILVSGSVGSFFYSRALGSLTKSLRSRLQNSAALLSDAIDATQLAEIQGPGDTSKEPYRRYLEVLRRMRRTNPDIAYLYVMRLVNDKVCFVIDSDETEKQAEPGRPYPEATGLLRTGFNQPSVDDDLVRDEWGVTLSGYAPLRNGDGHYLVGIDMRADEVASKLLELRLWGVVSLLASLLLALLFALSLSRGLTRRAAVLSARCREIADGHFSQPVQLVCHDEFDDLVAAFNAMSDGLAESRAQAEAALAALGQARDGLELRVAERTQELQSALDRVNVLSGLLPICASCKKVRDDTGYWQQVESFVEAHTEARFSHGLCPTCVVALYGDLLKDPPPDTRPDATGA